MKGQNAPSTLSTFVAFVVTALIASIVLISAFILYLGELIGSHLLAMVITGGVCAIVSFAIYKLSLKPIIKGIEEQITIIYEVTSTLRRAYTWAVEYVISRVMK